MRCTDMCIRLLCFVYNSVFVYSGEKDKSAWRESALHSDFVQRSIAAQDSTTGAMFKTAHDNMELLLLVLYMGKMIGNMNVKVSFLCVYMCHWC